MRINNNFNVLPFYDSLQKQNSKKWYSFGQHYPLICPNNKLLPFQFITNEELTITGNIVAVNVTTGQTTDLGVKPVVMLGTQPGAQYYIVKLSETAINKSLEGLHYLQINTNKGYIYSEEFVFTDSYSECVRLEYWNEDTLNFTSGEINFDDDFKFVMYISSTIGKPEYEFEEELTKRLGYKFIESQASNKIYKFNFLAPEYICDAMRLVRLCDYIKLTTKHDTYNALSFSYEPKWQNNGDLAAVDVEFDTDCIIQKLESFNRRLKESFYNALLADIDEPVLFSNDTVAQYYTEFTTTSYINGKLIRQLEAISEDELSKSINDIVLPIDNQSDTNQVAKKVFLSNIINKFAPQVDLSRYLLKSVWDSVFELRNDIETGKQYIYGKLPVVLQYGLTMYSGDGVNIPSIYAGLPIDNDTIYWEDGILKAKAGTEGAITEITSSMVTSALGYTPYDASNPNGYITSAALANYALSSDVAAVSSKLNDFLEGSDTDNIINKWKELETFLSGLSQSDNLATILSNKAEKTDLAKYIPIAGETDITGEKNFVGGLKVNGSPIYYDTEKKYWKLEGDLLVTGGVTMYGNDSDFVASTIMDAILYDDTTLGINANGELYVKGSVGGATTLGSLSNVGSWADSVAPQDRIMYQAANSSTWVAKNLSDLAVGGVTGDYLPLSGGLMTGDIGLTSLARANYNTGVAAAGAIDSGLTFMSDLYKYRTFIGSAYQNSAWNTIISVRHRNGYNDGNLYGFYLLQPDMLNLTNTNLVFRKNVNGNWSNSFVLLHSGNYSSYALPLSGGTINGQLKINTSLDYPFTIKRNSNSASYVAFENNNGYLGDIGFLSDGSLYAYVGDSNKTIWHSGNDGSGSGLDADLLDGHDGWWYQNHTIGFAITNIAYLASVGKSTNVNNLRDGILYNYGDYGLWQNAPSDMRYGQILNLKGEGVYDLAGQLAWDVNHASTTDTTRNLWWRATDAGDFVEAKWHQIAFIDSNVASATKLQTARTIWGQSFDGTGNVSGDFIAHNVKIHYDNVIDSINNQALHLNYYSTKNITLCYGGGNVGLGTNNPSYKFEVVGETFLRGGLTLKRSSDNSNSFYIGQTPEASTTMFIQNGSGGGKIHIRTNSGGVFVDSIVVAGYTTTINNNLLATGGITMYSDIRKKTKIRDVELSLKQIANAPLIEHYYNSDDKRTTHVGSIAQYWAEMNDWFCKLDNEGYYTMEIQNAALASAISVARELVKFETETDRRIRLLEEENKRLKEEVEQLKWNIT